MTNFNGNQHYRFLLRKIVFLICLAYLNTGSADTKGAVLTVTKSPPPNRTSSIATVVHSDVITQHDLDDRLKVLLFFMRLPDTAENRQEILPDVLKTLQEERLQLNELKNAKMQVEPDAIQEAYDIFEQQNGIPKGKLIPLLQQEGLSLKTLQDQATAQVGWVQLIRSVFHDQLRITDSEIEEAMQKTLADADAPQYLISEIFLDVSNYPSERDAQQHAEHILTQLTQGAPFPMVAHHFSQSASAATYGDIGWIRQDQLNPEWVEILDKAPIGSITRPLQTATGYYILAVRDKRKNADRWESQTVMTLKQVRFPVTPQGVENSFMKKLQRRVQGCRNLTEIAPLIPGCKVRDIENIPTNDIPPAIQKLIDPLAEGQLSPAHTDNNNLLAYMVCYTENRTPEEVLKEYTRQRLEGEKLNRISHQMLENLKQNLIDNRTL